MRMLIDGQGVTMTPEIFARTQERVCYTLVLFQRMVSWVAVQFTRFRPQDEEVCCQIDVWLHDIGVVTVQHSEENPIEAVEMAALRLREAVRRRLAKRGNPHLRPLHLREETGEDSDWLGTEAFGAYERGATAAREYDDAS